MIFEKTPTPQFEIVCRMSAKEAEVLDWLMGFDPTNIRASTTQQFTEEELRAVAASMRLGLREPLKRIKEAKRVLVQGVEA